MAVRDVAFQRRILKAIAGEAWDWVRPKIASSKGKRIKALQKALRVELLDDQKAALVIPHYWAIYVHDGRKAPVRATNGAFLIWWRDPRKDPRLSQNRYPERATELRHLTPREFRDAQRQNEEARQAGRPLPVIITRTVRKSTPGTRFFDNGPRGGMFGFVDEANRVGEVLTREFVLTSIRRELGVSTFIPQVPRGGGLALSLAEDTASFTL